MKFPPDKRAAQSIVRRLAKLGFNHVRFTGFDGTAPEVFEIWRKTGRMDSETMGRFDYFVYLLRRAGIYYSVSINNHSNLMLDALGGVPVNGGPDRYHRYRHVRLYDARAITAQRTWIEAFFSHKNPYTGLSYAADPANIYFAAVNEDSIARAYFVKWNEFGSSNQESLQALFNSWLREHVPTDALLRARWNEPGRLDLLPSESLTEGNVRLIRPLEYRVTSKKRIEDTMAFLVWVDSSYAQEIRRALRKVGYTGLFTQTNNWNGYGNLYANATTGDYVDLHVYFGHAIYGGSMGARFEVRKDSFLDRVPANPQDRKWLPRDYENLLSVALMGLVKDRPLLITEWNQAGFSDYAYEGPLLLTGYSAFQGVGLLDAHTYFSHPNPDPRQEFASDFFAVGMNPVWRSIYPTLALAFIRGDIREGSDRLHWVESETLAEYLGKTAQTGFDLRHIQEQIPLDVGLVCRTRKQLVGSLPVGSAELSASLERCGPTADGYVSSTGELRWQKPDGNNARFIVNTPRFQAIAGRTGGQAVATSDLQVALDNHGFVSAIALDDKPIAESNRILITAVSGSSNTGQRSRIVDRTRVVFDVGRAPPRLERVHGLFVLRLKGTGKANVYALGPKGEMVRVLVTDVHTGRLSIKLGTDDTPWYLVTREQRAAFRKRVPPTAP